MRYKTKLIQIGEEPNLKEGGMGDVTIPIHLTSTFTREKVGVPTNGYKYSRSGNPTRIALEKRLAALESAKFALAFSSGLAATTTLILSLVKSGDHIIASDDIYGGTKNLFNKLFKDSFGVSTSFVDTSNGDLEKYMSKRTKLIWLESPTNPLLKISDIKKVVTAAKKNNVLVVVDNTFLSPYFQKPLDLGADIVVHSTTKYINGHSDSVGGAIMLSDETIFQKIKYYQNAIGAILPPFDSYLVLRGIKTLAVRMEAHQKNAQTVSEFLESHSKVMKVYYPGLVSHPQHEIAKRQMSGFGGMITIEIKGGLSAAKKFLSEVKIFKLAESLGGVGSLIEHPALMTHASVSAKDRKRVGITDGMIRISVGLEDVNDLKEDLKQALG